MSSGWIYAGALECSLMDTMAIVSSSAYEDLRFLIWMYNTTASAKVILISWVRFALEGCISLAFTLLVHTLQQRKTYTEEIRRRHCGLDATPDSTAKAKTQESQLHIKPWMEAITRSTQVAGLGIDVYAKL